MNLADGWEHVDRTLRKDPVRIGLTPVKMVTSMGTAYTDAVPEPKANGYEVSLWVGAREGATERSLATFADVAAAWEFAALATHYVEARSPEALVPGGGESVVGARRPNGIVEDRSARDVFEELVGYDTDPIEGVSD